MKKLFLFITIVFSLFLKAQVIPHFNDFSPYQYIFKITNQEAEAIYKGKSKVMARTYFHTKVDSFPAGDSYTKEIPEGYYIFALSGEKSIRYKLYASTAVEPRFINNSRDLSMVLYDRKSKSFITSAEVTLGKKTVKYDPVTSSYFLRDFSFSGTARIAYDGKVLFAEISKISSAKDYPDKDKYEGYIAFNKPKYLPGDTVRIKAFLLEKGVPLKKPLKMKLKNGTYYNDKTILAAELKPLSKGAYVYEFVLGDSLTIDKNYYVTFYKNNKSEDFIMRSSFYLEDYQLNEAEYELYTTKKIFTPGDTLALFLKATDFNGLPLFDGKASVKVFSSSVTKTSLDRLYVPFVVFEKEVQLDASGVTKVTVPASFFPAADMNYRAEVKFANSNNELQEKKCFFSTSRQQREIEVSEKNDSLLITYLENNQGRSAQGFCYRLNSSGDTVSKTTLTFPSAVPLDPKDVSLIFRCNGIQRQWYPGDVEVELVTIRTKDSIRIELPAVKNTVFHIELQRNGKKIKEGNSTSFSYKERDISDASYKFLYQYIYAGDNRSEIIHIYPKKKSLNVTVDQPAKIFPGQSADVKIKVSDFSGEPVKDANITSGAINAQFDLQAVPVLPDFNEKTKIRKKAYFSMSSSIRNPTDGDRVDSFFVKSFGLDTMHYYKVMFPPKGQLYLDYIPVETGNAQFAPFIAYKSFHKKIHIIYVDDIPVYFSLCRTSWGSMYESPVYPWSFLVSAGKHTLRLRTADAEYTVKDVECINGKKLELAFDEEHLPPNVSKKICKRKLNRDELAIQKTRMFFLDNVDNYASEGYYFWQGDVIRRIPEGEGMVFNPNDSIRYYWFNNSGNFYGKLFFKPGFYYSLNDSGFTVKPVKKMIRKFPEESYEAYEVGQLCFAHENFRESKYSNAYYSDDVKLQNEKTTYKGRGALGFVEPPDFKAMRVVLNNLDTINAAVFYSGTDFENYSNSIHNLIPGNYKATFSNDKGESIVINQLKIAQDSVLCLKLNGADLQKADAAKPVGSDAVSYSIVYDRVNKGTIDAKMPAYRGADSVYFEVFVRKNGARFYHNSNAGHLNFKCEDLKSGIYDVFFVARNGLNYYFAIYGVILNENNAAHIILKMPDKAVPVFHYVEEGKDVPCYVALAGTDPYSQVSIKLNEYIPVRKDRGYAYESDLLSGRYENSSFYVDGKRIYDREYGINWSLGDAGSKIRFWIWKKFHIWRPRSSFYRSRYSSAFSGKKRKIRAGFGGGEMYDRIFGGNTEEKKETGLYNVRSLDDGKEREEDERFDTVEFTLPVLENPAPGTDSLVVRENFSDYAYWQPNLLTNEKGEVSFRVKFPDNITKWSSYALAMSDKQQSGKAEENILSYKPLMATLSAPRFLLPGDSVYVIGKTLNYSDSTMHVKTTFRLDKQVIMQSEANVQNSNIEKAVVCVSSGDTVSLEYNLRAAGGYSDGENEKIPVFPLGMEEAEGEYYFLERDTSFTYKVKDTSSFVYCTVLGNDVDVLLDRIKEISDYTYECNEQMASKLKAMLLEKKIKEKLGQKFSHTNEIRRLIGKLDKAQKENKSWGWWADSPSSLFMSVYVVDALSKAGQEGFKSKSLAGGTDYLKFMISEFRDEDLLRVLQIFEKDESLKKYITDGINKLEKKKELSSYSRFLLTKIKQDMGMDIGKDVAELMKFKQETILGGIYFGEHNCHWYNNSSQLSLIAYQVFQKQKGYETLTKGIRNYFFEHGNKNTYRNTYESALIVETLLPSVLEEGGNKLPQASIQLSAGNYKSRQDTFPYTGKIKSGNVISIAKQGKAPLYVSIYQKKRNTKPVPHADTYQVSTSFMQEGTKPPMLKAGKAATMLVEVNAKKAGDYVMISVPIPSGCSYNDKAQPYGNYEIHREYHKDKVLIFCETLPAGVYQYKIELQPRYEGVFNLNPAKTELMYFPVFFGNTEMKKLKISE